jgi:hypothetical protein
VRRTIELLREDEPTADPLGVVETASAPRFDDMLARVKALHSL